LIAYIIRSFEHTGKQSINSQTNKKQTKQQSNKQTKNRQTDRQTDRQKDRQTDKQTLNKQTNKQDQHVKDVPYCHNSIQIRGRNKTKLATTEQINDASTTALL